MVVGSVSLNPPIDGGRARAILWNETGTRAIADEKPYQYNIYAYRGQRCPSLGSVVL